MSSPLHCDVIRPLLVQTWLVYFLVSVQPLSTNFGSNIDFVKKHFFLKFERFFDPKSRNSIHCYKLSENIFCKTNLSNFAILKVWNLQKTSFKTESSKGLLSQQCKAALRQPFLQHCTQLRGWQELNGLKRRYSNPSLSGPNGI